MIMAASAIGRSSRLRLAVRGVALAALTAVASAGSAAVRAVAVDGANSGDCLSSACATISYAMTQAADGDTIAIGAGTFADNVVVDKAVVLAGAGESETLLHPATSGPTCATPDTTTPLCAAGSNVILVQAQGVEIRDLTIDGDNPELTSGVTSDGADLDARNGILTNADHAARPFHGLKVHDVTVKNVYLRGIFASSGGTFEFTGNTIQNVQASPYSICMFNRFGSGTMAGNSASGCGDAFSSNWSTGVQFLDNVVTNSGSAVHTDNAQGPTPDLIAGNQATAMKADSYGFWVFSASVAPTVRDNIADGVTVGLGAFGAGATAILFEDNAVDCGDRAGSLGMWVSTTLFGWGSRASGATMAGNVVTNCEVGLSVQAEAGYTAVLAATGNTVVGGATAGVVLEDATTNGTYDVELHHNRIAGNGVGVSNPTGQAVDAAFNWWGCNAGPGGDGELGPCDTVSGATFAPWLVLATPAVDTTFFALAGGSATVTTDLAHDSAGSSATGVPDGTPVGFSTSLEAGVLTPPIGTTVAGAVATTLTATAGGAGPVCATIDNEQLCTASVQAGGYHSVEPCRALDTRLTDQGQPGLTHRTPRDIQLGGVCGVPTTARLVAINVTVVLPTALGHLALYPADLPLGATSSVNFRAGTTRANNAIALLARDGSGLLRAFPVFLEEGGTADLVIDVFGYHD
jgi:hypothetical protein